MEYYLTNDLIPERSHPCALHVRCSSTSKREREEGQRYGCQILTARTSLNASYLGSLEDKTIRYPMSDPIFKKLLSVVMHNSRSVDWFGLTEQVINTVYAIAEQPAEFCSHLIKQLAQRVWNNPRSSKTGDDNTPSQDPDEPMEDVAPEGNAGDTTILSDQMGTQSAAGISAAAPRVQSDDVADAFELSQLLFVVGHVAIKQLVFFELVERDWKRQKEQKQAGANVSLVSDNPSLTSCPPSREGRDRGQVEG